MLWLRHCGNADFTPGATNNLSQVVSLTRFTPVFVNSRKGEGGLKFDLKPHALSRLETKKEAENFCILQEVWIVLTINVQKYRYAVPMSDSPAL